MVIEKAIAAITGGASGLGWATATYLASQGAQIAILDMKADEEKIAKELPDALFVKCDISNSQQVEAAIAAVVKKWGKIDILVSAASISVAMKTANKKRPHDMDAFKKLVEVNLVGTFDVMSKTAFTMIGNTPNEDGERGIIIMTASTAAYEGQIGTVAYSATKAAIAGMTLVAARDLASQGIRVMSIAPGVFNTPFLASLNEEQKDVLGKSVPFPNRLGKPEEFAMLVGQIIKNSMLNGSTIRLDGALRMQP
ncbi:SDR family NAD(P)-dependent oxidoreductase [Lachnospiraceae bacterium ZAX-1]